MNYQTVKVDGYLSEALSDEEGMYSLCNDLCVESTENDLEREIKVLLLESSDAMLELLKNEIERDQKIKGRALYCCQQW